MSGCLSHLTPLVTTKRLTRRLNSKNFVGEVDLPESISSKRHHLMNTFRWRASAQELKRWFVLFPIQYNEVSHTSISWSCRVNTEARSWIWQMYKKAEASFWTAEEMDLSKDLHNWNNRMNDNECPFISHVLAFFAASDDIINENLLERFLNEVQAAEARFFYGCQNIHSETYSLLINDPAQRKYLFKPSRQFLASSARRTGLSGASWIKSQHSLSLWWHLRLSRASSSAPSCPSSGWSEGPCPDLTFSNKLISCDEGTHTDFACLLFSHLKHRPHPEVIKCFIVEAVKIFLPCEVSYVNIVFLDALPVKLIGMNADLMCQYIAFVTDRLLVSLSNEKRFNKANPQPLEYNRQHCNHQRHCTSSPSTLLQTISLMFPPFVVLLTKTSRCFFCMALNHMHGSHGAWIFVDSVLLFNVAGGRCSCRGSDAGASERALSWSSQFKTIAIHQVLVTSCQL